MYILLLGLDFLRMVVLLFFYFSIMLFLIGIRIIIFKGLILEKCLIFKVMSSLMCFI